MCLNTVDKKIEKFEHGWKIFQKIGSNKNLYGLYYNTNYKYPVNKWVQAKPGTLTIRDYKKDQFVRYERGFHFYKTRKDARKNCIFQNSMATFSTEKYIVRKIKVKKVVASGTDNGFKTGVAKWMKILTDKT